MIPSTGSEIPRPTTWSNVLNKKSKNNRISTPNLNWWVDPGFLVAINNRHGDIAGLRWSLTTDATRLPNPSRHARRVHGWRPVASWSSLWCEDAAHVFVSTQMGSLVLVGKDPCFVFFFAGRGGGGGVDLQKWRTKRFQVWINKKTIKMMCMKFSFIFCTYGTLRS